MSNKKNSVEKTLHVRRVYTGRTINVVRAEVQLPSGHFFVRDVVQHPGAAAVVPVMDEGEILLIKQFRYPAGRVLLEAPAGPWSEERARNSVLDASFWKRLAIEPVGYASSSYGYLAPGYSTELIHIFVATHLSRARQKPDVDERIAVVKVSLAKALAIIRENRIRDAKTICGILALVALKRNVRVDPIPTSAPCAKRAA